MASNRAPFCGNELFNAIVRHVSCLLSTRETHFRTSEGSLRMVLIVESDQDNRRSIDHDNRWDGGFHGQDRRTDQVPVASLCSGSALRHQFRIQGTSLLNA